MSLNSWKAWREFIIKEFPLELLEKAIARSFLMVRLWNLLVVHRLVAIKTSRREPRQLGSRTSWGENQGNKVLTDWATSVCHRHRRAAEKYKITEICSLTRQKSSWKGEGKRDAFTVLKRTFVQVKCRRGGEKWSLQDDGEFCTENVNFFNGYFNSYF